MTADETQQRTSNSNHLSANRRTLRAANQATRREAGTTTQEDAGGSFEASSDSETSIRYQAILEAARKNAKTDEERAQLDELERCLRLRLSDSTGLGADVPSEVGVGPCDSHSRDNLSAISSQRTDMLRLRCDLSSGRAICVTNGGLVITNKTRIPHVPDVLRSVYPTSS